MSDTPKLNPLLLTYAMIGAAYRQAYRDAPAYEPGEKCDRCGKEMMVADFNRELLMCANPFCGEGA